MTTRTRVLLAGNPNSGKTTLFNALTGARARVGNYPGVTVERRHGHAQLGALALEVIDLPGAYSLTAASPEEQVAIDALMGGEPADAVVVLVDATALARGLYLALQVIEIGLPTVLALNMMDEARAAGTEVDVAALGAALGVPAVALVASRREGLGELEAALAEALGPARPAPAALRAGWPAPLTSALATVEAVVARDWPQATPAAHQARAAWALLSLGATPEGDPEQDELGGVSPALRQAVAAAHAGARAAGHDLDLLLVSARYATIDALLAHVVRKTSTPRPRATERIDALVTHRVGGLVAFLIVMAVVFQALFAWSEPAIAFIEARVGDLQGWVSGALADGPLRSLLVDGVIAGVGNVLVFVPQIALLFLFIGLLEDSGYLARVAFVIDRVMARVGLHGKAFVPMLSGYACAIPAVMSTRTIENRRDRLLTMLVVPLTSCSARLPIYVLVIATVFPGDARVGPMSVGALVLLGAYVTSALGAIGAAAILRRTVLRGPRPTMVLELPPYRWPVARNLGLVVAHKVKSFIVEAGTVILALTIVLWALLNYPRDPAQVAGFAAERAAVGERTPEGEARDAALAAIDEREAGDRLRHSAAGRLGHVIEPVIAPLGFDWRLGIGVLGAFAAREVFVSTVGVVFDVGGADEESVPLRKALRDARRADGSVLMTPLTGASLIVFFIFACQCLSTIAVVRRESRSWRWPLFMLGYMSALAYLASLLVYQGGRLLGWS